MPYLFENLSVNSSRKLESFRVKGSEDESRLFSCVE